MIAEVIASSTRQFEAEVYRTAEAPAFGTWVQVQAAEGPVLYGVVSHVTIGSVEPGRQARALGKTPDELRREMPQVLELLRTTFRAQVVAYQAPSGPVRQTLPPHPADLHAFVTPCTPADVQRVAAPYDFLRTLVHHPDPEVPVDDLLVALLGQVYVAHGAQHGGRDALLTAGKMLGRLLDDDHERLRSIFRRVAG
ncbi:MAG: hypothetical protein AAGI71_15850 [Bacteroidota bacterium]